MTDPKTKEFLNTHQLVDSDKNMGPCFVSNRWITAQQVAYISDPNAFATIGEQTPDGEWQVEIPTANDPSTHINASGTRRTIAEKS